MRRGIVRVPKDLSNPNVLIELGYAAALLGWDRVVLVLNKHYGSPERLPFDLKFRRFPITYTLGPQSTRRQRATDELTEALEIAIASCFAAEYTHADDVLSRLVSSARALMLKHARNPCFWETSADNSILSRLDLAVVQLLEFGVVRCIRVPTEPGLAYEWTYFGRECLKRLGLPPITVDSQQEPREVPICVDLSSYESLLSEAPGYHIPVMFTEDGLGADDQQV
jgi:hypothetical protein